MAEAKPAEIRREEILDAAQELFESKGYEQTSTTDIMKKVGIAKGTLYYHFASKEEILDAMVERMGDGLIRRARAAASQKEIPVTERLMRVLVALNAGEGSEKAVVDSLNAPRNELLHEKARQKVIDEAGPILSGLVEEAVQAGVCHCAYPRETVEMILIYALIAFDGKNTAQWDGQRMDAAVRAFVTNIERLLGAGEGTFDFIRSFIV